MKTRPAVSGEKKWSPKLQKTKTGMDNSSRGPSSRDDRRNPPHPVKPPREVFHALPLSSHPKNTPPKTSSQNPPLEKHKITKRTHLGILHLPANKGFFRQSAPTAGKNEPICERADSRVRLSFFASNPLLLCRPHMISIIEAQPAGSHLDLVKQVEEIFSPTGILSRAKNFEFRPQQQQMAVAVARALEHREHLAVEAGTGVGKSLAYLVPAILFAVQEKKKAVVSTHTINLQEQLTEKDLPMLAGVLGALPQPVKFQFTMLKGRANYLCTRRLQKAMQQSGHLFTSSEGEELRRIYEWSQTTKDGSLSDFDIEPDPKVWSQVCSERGLCSPKVCGYQSDFSKDHPVCFFQRARFFRPTCSS